MIGWLAVLVFVAATLASLFLIGALIPRLHSAQVIDIPNVRSLHAAPVPRGAGLVIALVVLAVQVALLGMGEWPVQSGAFTTLVAAGFAALGWADDRASRGVGLRLAVQALLAAVFVFGALPADTAWWLRAGMGLALLWQVNLFNFMDGADGFAGVQTISVALGLALLLMLSGHHGPALAACALAGAACGFLRWNWHPARIFLGDVGSYFIGFELGALAIFSVEVGHVPWPALILLAPFVIDASLTCAARVLRGHAVWRAHREHAYQALVLRGWSPARVSASLAVLSLVLCWPAAVLAIRHGATAGVFVYGLLAIIWLWLWRWARRASSQPAN